MAQIAKISEQIQLKCSGLKFYDFLKNKMDCFFQMFPDIFMSCKILEGNGFSHGSIFQLKYYIAGAPAEAKDRIAIDDANKSITFEVLEGDLFRDFEVFQLKVQAFDNGINGSSVNCSIEFVKANEDVAPPNDCLILLAKTCKGLDDYLCNN